MMSEECKDKLFRKLILITFALSGMTALIYEIVWSRPLELIFGSTVYAVSTILTTFIFGFALGSFLFRNIADRSRNPLFLFGILELGIGLYGLIIFYLFKIISNIYISLVDVPGNQFVQFGIMFLVLVIPSILFGATWPVLSKAYVNFNNTKSIGKNISELYAFNSLGSSIGLLAAGFLLIPLLGIRMTSLFASFTNLLIAVLVFIYSWGKNEY